MSVEQKFNARLAVVSCTPVAVITGADGEPMLEPFDPRWVDARMALSFGTNITCSEMKVNGLEIGDARSKVAARCREVNPKPLYCFFLDSDVIPSRDAFTKLFYWMKTRPHIDIACGVYVAKGINPPEPLIYAGDGLGCYWDWAVGDLLTTSQHGITGCHMGLTLIRVSLFDRLIEAGLVHGDGTDQDDHPFFHTTDEYEEGVGKKSGTEDLYFCELCRRLDQPVQILVDTSVLANHVDRASNRSHGLAGNTLPVERAHWLTGKDRKEADADDLKLAIDLGAGESRREWPGYKVYTLDAWKGAGCDYCQDVTQLNLPDGKYDLVASRHVFEHVGRWQQEKLWAETFRIAAPGAKLEIIVPSLQWAAEKIAAGEMDFDVMNVLYGSQELEGEWGLVWNTHRFGYTKEIAKALAEGAGWVDVQCQDWRDDMAVLYHMQVTGRKKSLEEDRPTEMLVEPEKQDAEQTGDHKLVVAGTSGNGEAPATANGTTVEDGRPAHPAGAEWQADGGQPGSAGGPLQAVSAEVAGGADAQAG